MARSRVGEMIQPELPRTTVFVIVVGLCLTLAQILGSRLLPGSEWAVIPLFVIIIGTAYARFAAAWTRRTERVIAALRAIAEGRDTCKDGLLAGVHVDVLGERARTAVEELGQAVSGLRQEKSRAELVLANMADGIIAVNSKRQAVVFNRAARLLLGVKDPDAVGKRLDDLDLHPEISHLVDRCLSAKKETSAEIRLPGWPQRTVSLRATPSHCVTADIDCAVIILHDLSDVRIHEQNQREFVSNVSHELKTPLTAVRTTAEALLTGAKNDEQLVDRFLNNIIIESDRLSVLVEDLMDIARLDSGIAETVKIEVDVAEAIDRAVSPVRPQAALKSIILSTSVEPGLTGCCDGMQLVQMIRNLVDNGVKYTPEGGEVEVVGSEVDSALVIAVRDTGIGIPHGEVGRIFERFYRVDKARSRRLGGTGLGLAIVKEIIESHGGEISVETELGRGSTFTVRLPNGSDGAEGS